MIYKTTFDGVPVEINFEKRKVRLLGENVYGLECELAPDFCPEPPTDGDLRFALRFNIKGWSLAKSEHEKLSNPTAISRKALEKTATKGLSGPSEK